MFDALPPTMTRVDEYGVLILAPEEETVPEDSVHEQTVDLLLGGLRARYAEVDDVEICGRLAWFPDALNTRIRLDPDVMVVRRPKGTGDRFVPGPRRASSPTS